MITCTCTCAVQTPTGRTWRPDSDEPSATKQPWSVNTCVVRALTTAVCQGRTATAAMRLRLELWTLRLGLWTLAAFTRLSFFPARPRAVAAPLAPSVYACIPPGYVCMCACVCASVRVCVCVRACVCSVPRRPLPRQPPHSTLIGTRCHAYMCMHSLTRP